MRIITANVNGLRSAARKGFFDWLEGCGADVVCLQEVRASAAQVEEVGGKPPGWHVYQREAEKPGYSGVAIYSREPAREVVDHFNCAEFDAEGRYIEARFDGLRVVSAYLPSGSSGPERQAAKYRFLDEFALHLDKLARGRDEVVLCGDWNIAHTENDIKNWRGNLKKAGFLPQERQWLSDLLDTGWVDVVRRAHPGVAGPYAWWSWRGKAFDNDAGWRIDYQLATPGLAARVASTHTERPAAYALRWSDHCPVTVDYR